MNTLHSILMCVSYLFRSFQYWIIAHKVPICSNYILLEAMQGKCYGCNIKPIYLELMSNPNYSNYYFFWSLRNTEEYPDLKNMPRTIVVKYHSKEYRYALAAAKYWIASSGFPEYVKKKKEQVLIQTWHGTPLKKLGCDIELEGNVFSGVKQIHKRYKAQAKQIDYFCAPSEYVKEKLTSAFDLKNLKAQPKWIETGYPRNDILYQYTMEDVRYIKNKLQIPFDKKVILYAPTFRDNQYDEKKGYQFPNPINIHKMQELFGDTSVWLFRNHSMIAKKSRVQDIPGFLYDVSFYGDISELYLISNLLITDYSSAFFDYANLKRPVIFFHYDLQKYQEEIRGFYLKIEELPGKEVQTEDELIREVMRQLAKECLSSNYQEFIDKYAKREGAFSSRNFVEQSVPICKKGEITKQWTVF